MPAITESHTMRYTRDLKEKETMVDQDLTGWRAQN